MGSHGPKASCVTRESRSPFEGAILVDGALIVNFRHFLPSAVQHGLTDRLAVWVLDSTVPKDAQIQSYWPGGTNLPSWEDTLPSPVE